MARSRSVRAVVVAAGALLLLSGCFGPLLPLPPTQTDGPTSGAPAGWSEFEHCDGAPEDPWVWVDGFPADAFEAAGVEPFCGDTWIEDDGENFVNVTNGAVTEADLDAIGTALEGMGYQALVDDFVPVAEGATPAYVGARDYYLAGDFEGDFTRLAIEIYSNGGPGTPTYVAYFDYLSPLTRALN